MSVLNSPLTDTPVVVVSSALTIPNNPIQAIAVIRVFILRFFIVFSLTINLSHLPLLYAKTRKNILEYLPK
jgi:hypothetical protein